LRQFRIKILALAREPFLVGARSDGRTVLAWRDGYDCAERITKKTVIPVVQIGKVEIRVKRFRHNGLDVCPVFQNRSVQFRTFG